MSTGTNSPRLTTVLELAPVVMVLSEPMVELTVVGLPFTVTCPVTLISEVKSFGAAKATMVKTDQTAKVVRIAKDLRVQFLPNIIMYPPVLKPVKLSFQLYLKCS